MMSIKHVAAWGISEGLQISKKQLDRYQTDCILQIMHRILTRCNAEKIGGMREVRKLPEFLRKYFWDVDFEKIDLPKRRVYVLRRILEYGDEQAVEWMWKNFKRSEIEKALSDFRGYTQKSANFWAFILNIKRENVKCLNRSFRETQKQFWPY